MTRPFDDVFITPEMKPYKQPFLSQNTVTESLHQLAQNVIQFGLVSKDRQNKSDFLTGKQIALDESYRKAYKSKIEKTHQKDPAGANLLRGASPFLKQGYFEALSQNYVASLGQHLQKRMIESPDITVKGETYNIHKTEDETIIAQWFDQQSADLKAQNQDEDWDHEEARPYLSPAETAYKNQFMEGMRKTILQKRTHKRFGEVFKIIDNTVSNLKSEPGFFTETGSKNAAQATIAIIQDQYDKLISEGMNPIDVENKLLSWTASLIQQNQALPLLEIFDHLGFASPNIVKSLKNKTQDALLDALERQEIHSEKKAERQERKKRNKLNREWAELCFSYNDYLTDPQKDIQEFNDLAQSQIDSMVDAGFHDIALKARRMLEHRTFEADRETLLKQRNNKTRIREKWAKQLKAGTLRSDEQTKQEQLDYLEESLANGDIGWSDFNKLCTYVDTITAQNYDQFGRIATFYEKELKNKLQSLPILSHTEPEAVDFLYKRFNAYSVDLLLDLQETDTMPTQKEFRQKMESHIDMLIRDFKETAHHEDTNLTPENYDQYFLKSSSISRLAEWKKSPSMNEPLFTDIKEFQKLLDSLGMEDGGGLLQQLSKLVNMEPFDFVEKQTELMGVSLQTPDNEDK